MTEDDKSTRPSRAEIARHVRKHVSDLMESGAAPADLSFTLAFVATELGLHFSSDGVAVFPVVLQGIAMAAAEGTEATAIGAGDVDRDGGGNPQRPAGAALH